MKLFRKITTFLLAAVMVFGMAAGAAAAENTESLARKMIRAYRAQEAGALDTIEDLLTQMAATDRDQANTWRGIMEDWDWINREMEICTGVLPDGLTQEDALAIVVMGYSLNSNGTMKPELVGRLRAALESARKYPNAYIVCTGGATSDNGVTEAGAMASWLIQNGVAAERVITEAKALSTTQNAKNVYRLLQEQYPQVKNIAVVTSDYHMKRSCLVMSAMSTYTRGCYGGSGLKLVANAAYYTGEESESVSTQAQALAEIVGITLDTGSGKTASGAPTAPSGRAPAAKQPASSIKIVEGSGADIGGITVNQGAGEIRSSGIHVLP